MRVSSAFTITTALSAPAADVWAGAVDPDGINYELGPWISMTMPPGLSPGMTVEDVPLGEVLGRSWIRLRGVPVDFDDLCLVERGPGMRFLERSRLGSATLWQHEREVVATGDATCEITDRLEITLRAPLRALGGARLAPRIVQALFTHRHKRLEERWGSVAATS
jgi:ligand-binding SRPBCC domain-containing protein